MSKMLIVAASLFCPLVGQTQEQPVYHTPEVAVLGWTGDSSTIHSTVDAQTIGLAAIDVNVDSGGVAHLAYNRQISDWEAIGGGMKATAWRGFPGMVQPATSVNRLKYRLGTFWLATQDNRHVQRWDAAAHTWRNILDPGVEFSDFDVTGTGQIVLVRTFGPGREHLFECFEERGDKPIATEGLPNTGLSAKDQREYYFYWDTYKVASCDTYIIAYAEGCGRLFVFDTRTNGSHEVATPWPIASPEWFRAQSRDFGVVNLTRFPGMNSVEFLPTGSRNAMQIAYQIPAKAPRKQVLVNGKPEMVKVGEDPEPNPVMVADLDFSTMSIKAPKPLSGVSLPLWVKEDGSLAPIKQVIESAKAKARPSSQRRGR